MSARAIARFAGALVRCGLGLFVAGLAAGLSLILHYFYTTPFDICSASFATMTVTEVWPWAVPLLAEEALALTLVALGLLAHARRSAAINFASGGRNVT